ncbi:MAG: DNA polymerase III subunit alpha [Paludibacteraceae bacterium]|nr:DNA polymerase III subunit alpha [Paludibacteraceae bacterium]
MGNFVHLHVHSHYSILDGMSKVPDLISKCQKNGMNAMALTDHGNMFGIKDLVDTAGKINGKCKKAVKECKENIEKETDPAKKAELEAQLPELEKKAAEYIPFKPIIGIEAYCARRTLYDKDKTFKEINAETGRERIVDRSGWHLILLAKNKTGYRNLCKLSSIAYTDGFYDRPRIDHNVLEKWHEGVICCSACLGGEIPQYILAGQIDKAEEAALWFKNLFGDDFYLEIQRHKTDKPNAATDVYEKQEIVNKVIIDIARKHDIKIIATNDVHFVEEDHGEAHDRLICISTGADFDDPNRMHYTKQEWLKTPEEMEAIFSDIPEALSNTLEIADKVEVYSIDSGPIMPKFQIPESFGTEEEYREKLTEDDLFNEFTRDENGNVVLSQEKAEEKIKKLGGYDKLYRIKLEADYLSKLTYEGAKERYGETLTDEQKERINFELYIMKTMGFPGYFLIVSDYIRAAREELGVWVGPGRGSAAGSVVAYCLKITNLDPLKYDLLFERFLNPDRISLPDIDVDFDDDGRGKVLDWVTQKYGVEKVAHIITYGTMATKSAIADVGRTQKVPLGIVNKIKGLVPDRGFEEWQVKAVEGSVPKKMPKVNLGTCYKYIPELQQLVRGEQPNTDAFNVPLNGQNENVKSMLKYAKDLEDTNRQIGIHACGVIIGAQDLTDIAPVCTIKDKDTNEDVVVTQYDGHVVESVGLIKMDFLGLKTLSLQKEALKNIKKHRGIDIDLEAIPIDDELTYKLYSEGRTIGTFQFESPGMQKYLRELKPTNINDLIAMNALYRPGPMDYIPQFIRRKHGEEPISYDIPVMEKYLKDTYGVTVYQEQVMLLSRLLAGFTRGQADSLRKAMGKKIAAMLADLKPKFIEGGKKNGHDEKILLKIWADWEKFASYAFNKSHAACYAWVAYQTGYLKAHYPAEYMAANLTRNKDSIEDVKKFMEECKAMNIEVKGPDVNESELNFSVTSDDGIRFGLGGIKGVGEGAVEAIVNEREKNGKYKNIFDFLERVNLQACNKKAIESLAFAGAFDCFDEHTREQYFEMNDKGVLAFCDSLIKYGNDYQRDRGVNQNTLFGIEELDVSITKPSLPVVQQWNSLMKLEKEKEMVGMYLSSHPLDDYYVEMTSFCTMTCKKLNDTLSDKECGTVGSPKFMNNKDFNIGGLVVGHREGRSKKGNDYGIITVADYSGQYEIFLMGNDLLNYGKYMREGLFIMVRGTIIDKKSMWSKFPVQHKAGEVLELGVKVSKIMLMNEVCEKMAETLTVKINLSTGIATKNVSVDADDIDEDSEKAINEVLDAFSKTMTSDVAAKMTALLKKKHLTESGEVDRDLSRGNMNLVFKFRVEGRWITVRSRKYRVAMSKQLEDFLREEKSRGVLDFSLN